MNAYSAVPSFNLKVVVAETGLKPDTIRAWERRYGLPQPERTSGGHRLYSERDIATLRWLLARKEEGLSISRAARLWRQIESQDQEPLSVMPLEQEGEAGQPISLRPAESLEQAREDWIRACLDFDETSAERALAEAFAAFPAEVVCFSVLQAGMATLGEAWYANRATAQQEHFASELALRRLEGLVAATSPPHRTGRILVGCAVDDLHTFSPLLLVWLLRRQGWEVVFLGANVPLDRLETSLAQVKPRLVVLTAQLIRSAAALQDMGFFLQQVGIRMAYGGLIFNRIPELRSRIPGEFLGERLEAAAQQLESLLRSEASIPTVPDRDPATQQALEHFQDHQGALARQVWRELKTTGWHPAELQSANQFLEQGIAAALSLGEIAFLGDDLQWLGGLMSNYEVNHGALQAVLRAYLAAARDQLDPRGAPIFAWLERATSEAVAPD